MLRQLFPDGRFLAPATPQEIEEAEQAIRLLFPQQLRRLYLECNGLREPRGNASYLLPLRELVNTSNFWHHEFPKINPNCPNLQGFIFFGVSSGDEAWGIDPEGSRVVAYHHWMGDQFEISGEDIEGVFLADYQKYDGL